MKVLVADKFEKSGIDGLRAAGCDVVYDPDLKDDALTEAVGRTSADVLVVRGTKVTAPMLDAGRLALIVRAGAGYNTIDVAGASKRGIYVSNCPGRNAIAVAVPSVEAPNPITSRPAPSRPAPSYPAPSPSAGRPAGGTAPPPARPAPRRPRRPSPRRRRRRANPAT